jgi:hypothetical protein
LFVITHRTPIRPRASRVDFEPPTLLQFVVLSMLLHVLIVVVFGNPIGTARRGDGWWGPLNVSLQRLLPDPGSGFTLAPGVDTTAPGTELLRRRDRAATSPAKPARNVDAGAAPSETGFGAAEERAAPPPIEAAPVPAPSAPARGPVDELLPQLDLRAPEIVDKLLSPPVVPRMEPVPAPAVELKTREATLPPVTPLQPIAPPKVERELAPPITVPQHKVPIAPVAPLERLAPPKIERELAPPITVPQREVPIAPVAPLERLAPPKIERELAPPVIVPAPIAPVAPVAPVERITPAKGGRNSGAAPESPPRREPAEAIPRAAPTAPAASTPGISAAGQAPAAPPSRLRFGNPDAVDEIVRPRGDVVIPSPEPGGASRIDLEAARRRAREITAESSGSRGIVSLVPPPPVERKSKLAEDIEKAAKPDCRTAYAGLGLLAIPALVGSTIGNGGCNW